jgi:LacI family gluconate utilization system Gnt-I transcriptional repressor
MPAGTVAMARESGQVARMARAKPAAREPLNLREVAARAGVSHMTVSRVVRRPETVAEPTRRRVLAAIEALGYVPNLAARDLARGASSFVCMVVSSIRNVFFAATVEGLVAGLDDLGLQVMLGNAEFSAEREARLVRGFVARRPAAVVLMGTEHAPETLRTLTQSRVPVIETWDLTDAPIGACVGFDNEAVGRCAARHLHATGGRRLVVVGSDTPRNRKRIAGFLAEAGRLSVAFARHCDLPGGNAVQSGREAMRRLMAAPEQERPDSVFYVSDTPALGGLLEARDLGLRVPEQVAVMGFGDHPMAAELSPSLTTIAGPLAAMGREAAALIARALEGEDIGGTVRDLGFTLLPRASTARAAQ